MSKRDAPAAELPLPESTTARHGAAVAPLLMLAADDDVAIEHRRFPRAALELRVALWKGEDAARTFSASLQSENLSVSGVFLHSTFFLPVGTELAVSFAISAGDAPVLAQAVVVRVQRAEGRSDAVSGMGLRFTAFHGQTEVSLARLFLGAGLRRFVEVYLASPRAKAITDPGERVVDALAAWELSKVSGAEPLDPWRGAPGPQR